MEKENYDLFTVVMICLGHFGDDNYAGILKLTAEQAMAALKVPEAEWTKYVNKLDQ